MKLKDCPPPGVEPGHYGHTNGKCSHGIGLDRWTSGGHLEIPLSCHAYTNTKEKDVILTIYDRITGLVIKQIL
jgi:hypothetical protein